MTQTKYRYLEVDETGKPCHKHTYNGVEMTGGSTIVGVLGKTLEWWAAELSAITCLEVGEKIPTIREEYLQAVASDNKKKSIDELQEKYPIFKKARFAHFNDKNTKADKGTDMHQDLENYIKDCIENHEGKPYIKDGDFIKIKQVDDFSSWAVINVKKFLFSEAYCFDEDLFVGGISDAGAEMQDGSYAIIDFKSAKVAYFNHFVQIAIYNILMVKNGLVDKNGVEIMKFDKPITQYLVFPFGMKNLAPTITKNTEGLIRAGRACVELYRAKSVFEQ